MDFLELARARRSVRSYDGSPVGRRELESCVEAARLAPSACNCQPWKFVIIDEQGLRTKVAGRVIGRPGTFNDFARRSGAFIAVFSEPVKFPSWAGSKIRRTDFRRIDLGLACAHILLRACELGIGTCVLGWFDEKELKKLLRAPRDRKIELLIALGHPAEFAIPPRRLKEPEKVMAFNSYDGQPS